MKVLIINGSPRENGNTSVALSEIEKVFAKNGIETETIQVGQKDIRARYGFHSIRVRMLSRKAVSRSRAMAH